MNKPGQKIAMISSTSLDLPEHRPQVRDACLREGFFPDMMESLPARDADAIKVSLEMVERADIYIGIFAHRYGHVPEGHEISITEMEFRRAEERSIPILVFLIDDSHPITIQMVEKSDAKQKKLTALKERASKGRGRAMFKSPDDLRGLVVQALSAHKQSQESRSSEKALDFHPPNLIPKPPEPYIAHPYSLLQTKHVVGRQVELNLLTDWVTANKEVPVDIRIFSLVAIGGMGKSALTWKWFSDIVPNELPKLAGRLWWSFYESDAHWENFIIRALAYVSGQSEKAVREIASPDREDQLWRILNQQPFLLVLDGLERILLAYARMDAAQMLDDDLDEQTANRVIKAHGVPESAAESFVGRHRLRRTVDHRAGQFLRRLARVKQSRILITTRLYPAELQADTGNPLPACFARFLLGLEDDDALNLWREFTVSGSREQLLPVFKSFGNYPLLLRALAGEVAAFRDAPGNFDKWRQAHPKFDPAGLPLKNAKTHVLEYALRGLTKTQRQVLHTLAAFRMPATWDTLRALLVESERQAPVRREIEPKRGTAHSIAEGQSASASATGDSSQPERAGSEPRAPKPCPDDGALDAVLTELEDRGLMGWDKRANRYDLHPIVRGIVWTALASEAKQGIYRELHTFFDAAPRPPASEKVECIEDLTPVVELFDKLVGLERYEDALIIFRDHLFRATYFRLSATGLMVELLERLFPDGVDGLPQLQTPRRQSYTLNCLGMAYQNGGEPGRAAPLFRRAAEIDEREKDNTNQAAALCNLAIALCSIGRIREAEAVGLRALKVEREQLNQFDEDIRLLVLGDTFPARGQAARSQTVLRRALSMFANGGHQQFEGVTTARLAQHYLWLEQPEQALSLTQRAWELAGVQRVEVDFIRAARLHGEAALRLGDLATAEERVHHALARARAVFQVEEELPALTTLAELHRQREQYDTALELLDEAWSPAERGPYPLLHADALNVLVQIKRDQGNQEAALSAAKKAYTLAWCDGPPYAYHYGLTRARKHLQDLGTSEPELPPFEESKFEPMPEVELNPRDKFWVDI